jgi:HEAT repeat protein
MDTPISEVRALVARLNNLNEIFRVQGEILSYSEAAVEPLAELLLSEPSSFSETRVAAAECLGVIGSESAIAALIQVLGHHDLTRLGPVQRFAEEMVRNAAARKLGRFPQPRVIEALLFSLRRDHLIGAGEALAQLAVPRAIPGLIECLEDDYKKEKATEALRQFRHTAVPLLCAALQEPRFVLGVEPPVSAERRCRAAQLLGELKAEEAGVALNARLREENVEVRNASAVALAKLGFATRKVIVQLLAGLDNPDLLVRKSCEEGLQKASSEVIPLLAQAVSGKPIHAGPQDELCLTLSARLVAVKILGSIPDVAAVHCLMNQLKRPRGNDPLPHRRGVEKLNFPEIRPALEQIARNDWSRRVKMRARDALQTFIKRNIAKAS